MLERRKAFSHRDVERENSVGNKRRVVSLDSIDSRDSNSAFSDSKPRAHSAGASTTCTLNGAVMNPLMFEEVDVKSTPLSSLRSCSEFQHFKKISSSSSWRGRGDPNFPGTKSSMTAYLSSFFWSRKTQTPTHVVPGSGLKKKKLKGVGDDERSFFVESMTKRDESDIVDTSSGKKHSSRPTNSRMSGQGLTALSSSSGLHSQTMPTVLPSMICLPRVSFTSAGSFSSSSSRPVHHQQHRKSIEEVAREENLANVRRRQAAYEKKQSLLYESAAALDMLFGFRSTFDLYPMEIELKTIRVTNGMLQDTLSDAENFATAHDGQATILTGDVGDNNVAVENRGGMPRSNLSLRIDPSYPNFGLSPVNEYYARTTTPHNVGGHSPARGTNATTGQGLSRILDALKDVKSWRPAVEAAWARIPIICREIMSGPEDDVFYEQLRIQPFGFGAYLRGMLWAGFSSLFFNSYSLVLWPELPLLTPFGRMVACLIYVYLFFQFFLNVIQLPLRVKIHLQCWESSRTVDVEAALGVLRTMLHSDVWVVNRFVGRCQDILSACFLVFGEIYIHFGVKNASFPQEISLPGKASVLADDPLQAIVVSICASTLLSLLMRLVVATVFSLSCHDPAILLEARKRGLSRLDIDVLPTFVFTSLDEVNNQDCSICLCDFEMGEMLISLPCGKKHSFHANCIRQWLERQNSCPLCQRIV